MCNHPAMFVKTRGGKVAEVDKTDMGTTLFFISEFET